MKVDLSPLFRLLNIDLGTAKDETLVSVLGKFKMFVETDILRKFTRRVDATFSSTQRIVAGQLLLRSPGFSAGFVEQADVTTDEFDEVARECLQTVIPLVRLEEPKLDVTDFDGITHRMPLTFVCLVPAIYSFLHPLADVPLDVVPRQRASLFTSAHAGCDQ